MVAESPVMELAEVERDYSGALTRAGWITTTASHSVFRAFGSDPILRSQLRPSLRLKNV
jgi:hypothetical protein